MDRNIILSRCTCAILWMLLFHFVKGEVCGVPEQSSEFPCPKLCTNSTCTCDVLQSYTASDMTSRVRGCIGDGMFTTTAAGVEVYEENHIIYSKTNSSITKIYLTVSEDATPSHSIRSNIPRKYNFVLLTTSAVTWVVSYPKNDVQYNFYVNRASLVRDFSGSSIKSGPVDIKLTTMSGHRSLYSAGQIRNQYCDEFQSNLRKFECFPYVTSVLKLNETNSFDMLVGKIPSSNANHQICSLPRVSQHNFSEDEITFKALFLRRSPISQSCSRREIGLQKSVVYAVDLDNNESDSSIRLQLFGALLSQKNTTAIIALRSKYPVIWNAVEAASNPILANLTFLVSFGSHVNTSVLQGSRVKVITSSLLDESSGTYLIEQLSSVFGLPVSAYSKFDGNPTLVNVKLEGSSDAGSVPNVEEDFYLQLHGGFIVNSSVDARLWISCKILTRYKLKLSDLLVGNGSCEHSFVDGGVIYSNLSRCGLKRVSYEDFEISVRVKGDKPKGEGIRRRIEPTDQRGPSLYVYDDITRNHSVSQEQVVTRSHSTFFTKIHFPFFKTHGISSQLDHCYLRQNNTNICSLIQDNCPVNDYASFLVHSREKLNDETGFSFSLLPLLLSGVVGSVDLVCVVSKCFLPHRNLTWTSALPQCPPESNVACKERSFSTDLVLNVEKSVSMTFTLETVQSSTAVWTSNPKTTGPTLSPCVVRTEKPCSTMVILVSILTVLICGLALLMWFQRRSITALFFRHRLAGEQLKAVRSCNNHTDLEEVHLEQTGSLLNFRSPSLFNIYDESLNEKCDSTECCGSCPLITDKLSTKNDNIEGPVRFSLRTKENSTCSSSSSDSGLGGRKSLEETSPIRESIV